MVTRLFFQTVAVLLASGLILVILRELVRGHLGDFIIKVMMDFGHLDIDMAWFYYYFYIRNNMELIIIAFFLILFLILFRVFLSWFTRYFDEMVAGVDQLVAETDEPIEMSPELGFMSEKLNEVKRRLKNRQEEARAAEQRKNDLVVYLAHDIRTPLTSVIGYLSLLDEDAELPEPQKKKYAHIALEKAYRLETLVNEFFEITRYRFQAMALQKENIDLCYMLVQMVDEMYPLGREKGQNFAMDMPETVMIFADPDKFARVLMNLLKNAIAYGDRDSVIQIRVAESTAEVSVQIENQGSVPRERLAKILKNFIVWITPVLRRPAVQGWALLLPRIL